MHAWCDSYHRKEMMKRGKIREQVVFTSYQVESLVWFGLVWFGFMVYQPLLVIFK